MTESLPRVRLQPRRARPFHGRHPWVYPGAIAKIEGDPADGAEVDLVSHADEFIARGLYNSQSKIRVRLYSWDAGTRLDADFFRSRLAAAIALRRQLDLLAPATACRLVFSEGDGLSGLTIDRYGDHVVMQFTSLALAQRIELFTELVRDAIAPASIYVRTERGIGALEGLEMEDKLQWGEPPPGPVEIVENDIRYLVNITEGQKTGFYIDQRENRAAVARYARGRRVLDAFCYTGGFGLVAARNGASEVLGLDVSAPALALAEEHARINHLPMVRVARGDVFAKMQELIGANEQYGMVILDPPKFARNRQAVHEAMKGHGRLQTLGLKLLEKGGILVICCCSGLITMPMLEEFLAEVAMNARRTVQILERRGQAADHPVAAGCPESSYLKCLICRAL